MTGISDEKGKQIILRSEIADILEKEWDHFYRRLSYTARKYARYLSNYGEDINPDELISEAVTRTLDGTRKWDRNTCPDLLPFLINTIKSIASSQIKSLKRHGHESLDENVGYGDSDKDYAQASTYKSPEEVLKAKQLLERFHRWANVEFADDPDVQTVIMCLEEEITKPQEIAEFMEIPVKDVYRILQRYRRRFAKGRNHLLS